VKSPFEYVQARSPEQAAQLLEAGDARPMGGGTDLLTQLDRGIRSAATVVDLRGLGMDGISLQDGRLRIGATTSVAALTRDPDIGEGYTALASAAAQLASPQLREMGTVAGNLCQQPRCWYFRHPDLECWLRGGDTCYAQIGDHRKHGLQPGDCISVAPSDLAAALLALDARVHTSRRSDLPLAELYRRPSEDDRTTLTLAAGEIVTAAEVPRAPDASSYQRAGERQAWSFALAGVAAARFGDQVRLAAIGVANIPILLDPGDPLADLPGMEMSGWKRRLLQALAADALAEV
jgi:xanthine dehydrogenase YagS FAD-binding subunit